MPPLSAASVAIAFAYFGALTWWGTHVLHRLALPGQTALTRLPLALLAGLATQLLAANFLSYVVPPPRSFGLALALQALSLVVLRRRTPRPLTSSPRGVAAVAGLLAAVVVVTFAARAFTEFQQDNFRQHWLVTANILDGNFPVVHPFDPDATIRYHYGTELLGAEIAWVSGTAVLWSPQFGKTAFVLAFLLLAFGFVYEERQDVRPALLAWAVLYFYIGLPEVLGDLGAGVDGAALLARLPAYGQHNQFVHFPSAALFVQTLAAGWPLALAALYVVSRLRRELDLRAAALLVLLVGALALTSTPEFVCTVGGIAVVLAASLVGLFRGQGPAHRGTVAVALVGAIAVAAIQGGVLTDVWRAPIANAPSEYGIRWPPGVVTGFNQVLPIGTWAWFREIVLSTDGLALLTPLAVFVGFRRASPAKAVFLGAMAVALALSQFVSYPSGEFNTNRPLAFAVCLSLLVVLFDRPASYSAPVVAFAARASRWAAVGVAVAGCVPALLFDAAAVGRALGAGPTDGPSYLYWWDDAERLAAAAWVRTVTPRGARIATNDPPLLVALSGRFAPNGALRSHGFERQGLSTDPHKWTAEGLTQAGVDAVCLFRSPTFESGDVDLAALARELAAGGPNVGLLSQALGPNAAAIITASPDNAAAALNAIVLWQPNFAKLVDLNWIGGAAGVRDQLRRARASRVQTPGSAWMTLNRAALQGMFPVGTRASWVYSEEISDEHLVRYPWYAALVGSRGAGAWLTPPPDQGAGKVRCLVLEPNRR